MELLNKFLLDNQWVFISALLFLLLIIFVLNLKLASLRKRFEKVTSKGNATDLEQVISEYTKEMELVKENLKRNTSDIENLTQKVSFLKGKVAIKRYNGFGEEGNDFSYSIAFLDENKDGVVISSIYNRGESNTYAKPVEKGESYYKLSEEEQDVIKRANS